MQPFLLVVALITPAGAYVLAPPPRASVTMSSLQTSDIAATTPAAVPAAGLRIAVDIDGQMATLNVGSSELPEEAARSFLARHGYDSNEKLVAALCASIEARAGQQLRQQQLRQQQQPQAAA